MEFTVVGKKSDKQRGTLEEISVLVLRDLGCIVKTTIYRHDISKDGTGELLGTDTTQVFVDKAVLAKANGSDELMLISKHAADAGQLERG